ncbi:DUF600 domain-containing protein [Bhargavaea massiliensis]|uniref:DUF600 domain-containing protein n=1 Tax=Bhargavaea massiliensis TaxID=2697500 RepID=UPI001BCAB221|nr:DUF600 domain-containing protein [Bhargavaea massiliensis]
MVASCLEYVDGKADDIYIYGSYEPDMYAFNVFYRINGGEVVRKHQLNEAVESTQNPKAQEYDVSRERMSALTRIGMDNLELIHEKCQEFNREMPTEFKLHYDIKQNKLAGKYRYDLAYSNDDELLPADIFDAWFEEVKNQEN